MTEEEFKEKIKKYENKFEGSSLPIFCDYTDNFNYLLMSEITYPNGTKKEELLPYDNFINVVEELTINSLYYPYNTMIRRVDSDGTERVFCGHSHAHDFEEVVLEVYHNPNSFYILEENYSYYSKQQLDFLIRFQNFLKLVRKPNTLELEKENNNAFNELAKKYRKYKIKTLKDDKIIENLLNGKHPYIIFPKTNYYRSSINDVYLICDKNNNYIAAVKIINEKEIEISKLTMDIIDYKAENYDTFDALKKDLTNKFNTYDSFNDYIVICYVEILERFN